MQNINYKQYNLTNITPRRLIHIAVDNQWKSFSSAVNATFLEHSSSCRS